MRNNHLLLSFFVRLKLLLNTYSAMEENAPKSIVQCWAVTLHLTGFLPILIHPLTSLPLKTQRSLTFLSITNRNIHIILAIGCDNSDLKISFSFKEKYFFCPSSVHKCFKILREKTKKKKHVASPHPLASQETAIVLSKSYDWWIGVPGASWKPRWETGELLWRRYIIVSQDPSTLPIFLFATCFLWN